MAKRSAAHMLRRWFELDRLLASPTGLDVGEFASKWGVDEKTVRRDLKAFKELGQVIIKRCIGSPYPHAYHYASRDDPEGPTHRIFSPFWRPPDD
jgi:hypothetical protein